MCEGFTLSALLSIILSYLDNPRNTHHKKLTISNDYGKEGCILQDYLHQTLDKPAMDALSALGLAHIGDAVYELLTRARLAADGSTTAKNLHKKTIALVCAPAQARAAKVLLPLLTEEESAVFRHGRNAKPGSVPKSCTHGEYSLATALEALFGWLYLRGDYDRVNTLYDAIVHAE